MNIHLNCHFFVIGTNNQDFVHIKFHTAYIFGPSRLGRSFDVIRLKRNSSLHDITLIYIVLVNNSISLGIWGDI